MTAFFLRLALGVVLRSGGVRARVPINNSADELFPSAPSLARHGYRVSPGTLYPMLHAMERKGYLQSRTERAGRSHRRVYQATPFGNEALAIAQDKIREPFREVVSGGDYH